jgi:hypothetical protein
MTRPKIPAVRKTFCQENTASNVPNTIIDKEAPKRELIEIVPHTLPYFVEGYHTEMILAMEGQLAAIANSKRKFIMEKILVVVPQLKVNARNAVIERATKKTLRPPSQSAITPVRSFPAIIPAIPQAATSP